METSPSHSRMERWGMVWAGAWVWNSPVVPCERGGSLRQFRWEIHFFQLIHVPGTSPFLAMVTVKLAESSAREHAVVQSGISLRALSLVVPGAGQTQVFPLRLKRS